MMALGRFLQGQAKGWLPESGDWPGICHNAC
jgi:hypothetical protein